MAGRGWPQGGEEFGVRDGERSHVGGPREGRSVGLGMVSIPTWESVVSVSQSCLTAGGLNLASFSSGWAASLKSRGGKGHTASRGPQGGSFLPPSPFSTPLGHVWPLACSPPGCIPPHPSHKFPA